MKKNYIIILTLIVNLSLTAQQTSEGFTFDNEARTYLLYVPTSYNSSTDTLPFVFALHGLGDTKENFNSFNGLESLAESEKFILVTPQAETPTETVTVFGIPIQVGTLMQNGWHSGAGGNAFDFNGQTITLPQAYYVSSSRDDVGFLRALLDTVSNHYNVDSNRVYSTGFSMGGFMTNKLACEMSDKIAAIASVSGTIGNEISNSCNPEAIIPALHIHSLTDSTVGYDPNNWGLSAEDNVDFWINNNNCNTSPDTTDYSSVVADNFTTIKYLYTQGDSASEVEFYYLEGPSHNESWYAGNNKDINTAEVIWAFFNRHEKIREKTNPIDTTTILDISNVSFNVFPNPITNHINIVFSEKVKVKTISIINTLGKIIQTKNYSKYLNKANFTLKNEAKGIYFLQIENSKGEKTVSRFYKK